jgi:nitrite reductase/ring-hydroxylating ferredoxin subunit/DMSO/TMAO reductase YedYZ heme-binding membrane subunit
MSVSYKAVGWNPFKKRYDLFLTAGVVICLVLFIGVGLLLNSKATLEIQLIRATAITAFLLLHLVLIIGPMARLDKRWLPLLYNRRHLGVTLFLLALIHAVLAILIYHGGADINPIVSVLLTDSGSRMGNFPFQIFGFIALLILFVMAATSHDFWLANLTAPIWKSLHMGVYVAYASLVVHVAFGVLQAETHFGYALIMGVGIALVVGLHLRAGWKQQYLDREFQPGTESNDGYIEVCGVDELKEDIPFGATIGGERVAIIRYEDNKISAVSGVCQHQNGPLAEGKFVKGCLTCPWHGYQYVPASGSSPEPFTEKIPTFDVRVEDGKVFLNPKPNKAGSYVEPALT